MTSAYFEKLKSSSPEAAEFLGNAYPIGLDRGPEPLTPGASDNTCWIWQGPAGSRGFAYDGDEPIARKAHSLLVGPIPPGKFVKRECGNRLCVNPRHLRLTTPEKIGSESAGKLTPAERDQALAALEAGDSQSSVARRFGITQPAVAAMKRRASSEEQPRPRHMPEWLDKQTGRLGLVGQLARGVEMPDETLYRALELATKEWTAHQGLLNEYEARRRSATFEQGEVAWD